MLPFHPYSGTIELLFSKHRMRERKQLSSLCSQSSLLLLMIHKKSEIQYEAIRCTPYTQRSIYHSLLIYLLIALISRQQAPYTQNPNSQFSAASPTFYGSTKLSPSTIPASSSPRSLRKTHSVAFKIHSSNSADWGYNNVSRRLPIIRF